MPSVANAIAAGSMAAVRRRAQPRHGRRMSTVRPSSGRTSTPAASAGAGTPTCCSSPRSPACRPARRSTSGAARAATPSGWPSPGLAGHGRRHRHVRRWRRPPGTPRLPGSATRSRGSATTSRRRCPTGTFDLVASSYLHSKVALDRASVLRAAATARPSGRHARDRRPRRLALVGGSRPRSRRVDLPSAAEVVAGLALGDGWDVERCRRRRRAGDGSRRRAGNAARLRGPGAPADRRHCGRWRNGLTRRSTRRTRTPGRTRRCCGPSAPTSTPSPPPPATSSPTTGRSCRTCPSSAATRSTAAGWTAS